MPSLVEIGPWFLGRKFSYFVNVYLLLGYYLPLDKGVALNLYTLKFPSPKDALCQVWLKMAGGLGEDVDNVKSLQTDIRTDDRQSEKLT